MEINLKGKRVLVTGAGKGIGRDVCLLLHEVGASVVAVSRSQSDLEGLKKEIHCEIIVASLENADEARQAAEAAGDIDLLVNSAGIARNEPFLEASVENFDATMNVNVRTAFIVSQVVARKLVARGKPGAIVNLSSQASMVALKDHTAYCTSKGALDQLTRMMALELGSHNIRVNAVNPTVTLTPMGEKNWSDPAKAGPMLEKIPLRRFALPREVSNAVVFLLSDQASMINGTMLPVDGGFLAN
eukprot:TRINITY_DN10893_c0_g1_i1.p1 TRINITY_DN10893_c0_g1~~TRINITY_DN10893_c0_g1_i1.p1  ORF type:complete len:244 (-),score=74.61 TRINITY_DN10893_c0_g1_i1:108-839(-)